MITTDMVDVRVAIGLVILCFIYLGLGYWMGYSDGKKHKKEVCKEVKFQVSNFPYRYVCCPEITDIETAKECEGCPQRSSCLWFRKSWR